MTERERGMRGKETDREIEAVRIKTSKEKGAGHTEFTSESPTIGERGQARRQERREERREDRQENRQERREERRENR